MMKTLFLFRTRAAQAAPRADASEAPSRGAALGVRRAAGLLAALILAAATSTCSVQAAESAVSLLQKGLFEEEAQQNLDAAIKAYQGVLAQAEEQRKIAATAVFRLGECYRKQGLTNEAAAQYQRLLRDYSDQATLAKLSQQNLAGLGMAPDRPAAAKARPDLETLSLEPTIDAETKELTRLEKLKQESPDLLGARDDRGRSPLHKAIASGQLKVLTFLLENKVDLNAFDKQGWSPTYYAVQYRQDSPKYLELLLARGTDPNAGSATPLCLAADRGQVSLAETLLKAGANVNLAQTSDGYTPLHAATRSGHLAMVELLHRHKADLNAKRTKAGPSVNEEYQGAPLHLAVLYSRRILLEWLCAHGADVQARNYFLETPLHLAAGRGDTESAALLLQHGASPSDRSVQIRPGDSPSLASPLLQALNAKSLPLVELLLKAGAEVNGPQVRRGEGHAPLREYYPLNAAIAQGNLEAVRLLLRSNAEVTIPGFSPLMTAVHGGQAAICAALLEAGASWDFREQAGSLSTPATPLFLAVVEDAVDVVEVLLKKGAKPNGPQFDAKEDNRFAFCLNQAISKQNVALVKLLLQHGASLDIPGASPLTTAVLCRGHYRPQAIPTRGEESTADPLAIAKVLLAAGAAVDVLEVTDGGMPSRKSPLACAVSQGDLPMVELLLRHRADPNQRTSEGDTPFTLAQARVRSDQRPPPLSEEIVNVLRQHGGREEYARLGFIYVRYGNRNPARVFRQDDAGRNRHTLLELLHYCPERLGQPFRPDWSQVRIQRLDPKTLAQTNLTCRLPASLADSADWQDVPLAYGDIVELTERVARAGEPNDRTLPPDLRQLVLQRTARKVTLLLGEEKHELQLHPASLPFTVEGGAHLPLSAPYEAWGRRTEGKPSENDGVWLRRAVLKSGWVLNTSDLKHVKVRRSQAGETQEWTYDFDTNNFPNDLWLRDGDVISVPSLPSVPTAEPAPQAAPQGSDFPPLPPPVAAADGRTPLMYQWHVGQPGVAVPPPAAGPAPLPTLAPGRVPPPAPASVPARVPAPLPAPRTEGVSP